MGKHEVPVPTRHTSRRTRIWPDVLGVALVLALVLGVLALQMVLPDTITTYTAPLSTSK